MPSPRTEPDRSIASRWARFDPRGPGTIVKRLNVRLVLALAIVALPLVGRAARAQDTLSVERLQEAALRSDPRAGQRTLLRQATDLRLAGPLGKDTLSCRS